MAPTRASEEPTQPLLVRSFVRRFRTEILAAWRLLAREIPVAQDLSPVVLVDHIPELLDQIGDVAEEIANASPQPRTLVTARNHALDRINEGFDVSAVVRELSLLRHCLLVVWEREHGGGNLIGMRALDLAIDRAIEASVTRYSEARERTLAGIDRISTATLTSRSVAELLQRLLSVFKETAAAVDMATILLVEGDLLHTRAAVGLDEDISPPFSLRIGEGFAGMIAAEQRPMALRSAYTDPIVVSDAVRRRGIRALYGVPLVHDGVVIGVAHMGSTSAFEFSQDDRQFFDSLVARATAGIVHQVLRGQLARSEDRYKQLAALRERALAKLESLLAASPVGIAFVDRELRFLQINEALARLDGRPAAEHIGRTVAEMVPAYAEPLDRQLRRVLETGESALNVESEMAGPTPDDRHWLLASYFPVRSPSGRILGVGAIVLDVSSTRQVEEALRVEQTRLQSIVEHSPLAIWIKDPTGRIVLANERLGDALGHARDDLIGKRSDEVLPFEVAKEHQENDAAVLRDNRAIQAEETAPSPDGPRTFLTIKFPIPGDPPLLGAIATEITERKRMEEALRVSVRIRDEMMAVVSHDLRGPLSAVQLAATLLVGEVADDARARRHLEVITRSCARMETLIDDLLDTALIRAGRVQLELHRETADSLVREALDLHESLATQKGVTLGPQPSVPSTEIECDRGRILQVFGNLIGNSLKFCRTGDRITIGAEHRDDVVEFCVEDTGPGIAAEALPHLFEPYWSGPAHVANGSGLGLYIVRGIVESHGGHVWADSQPGAGARFFFTLPQRAGNS